MWPGCTLCNCRDLPSNPQSPFKIIRDLNGTIDTAMAQVDSLVDKVLCQAVPGCGWGMTPCPQADSQRGPQCAVCLDQCFDAMLASGLCDAL